MRNENPLLVERRGHLWVAGIGLPMLAVIGMLGIASYAKENLWNQAKGATRPVAKLLYSEIPANATIDVMAPLVPTKVKTIAVGPDPMSDLDANGDTVDAEEAASKPVLAQGK
jgi:hypothetical protein